MTALTFPVTIPLRAYLDNLNAEDRDQARIVGFTFHKAGTLSPTGKGLGVAKNGDDVTIRFRDDAAAVEWKLIHNDDLLDQPREPLPLIIAGKINANLITAKKLDANELADAFREHGWQYTNPKQIQPSESLTRSKMGSILDYVSDMIFLSGRRGRL